MKYYDPIGLEYDRYYDYNLEYYITIKDSHHNHILVFHIPIGMHHQDHNLIYYCSNRMISDMMSSCLLVIEYFNPFTRKSFPDAR